MTKSLAICFTTCLILQGCSATRVQPLDDQLRRISDLNERALASFDLGYTTDSTKLLNEALHLSYALDDRPSQIITLLNKSRTARHGGRKSDATKAVDQAIVLAHSTSLYADAAQEKALVELAAGNVEQALSWAENARSAEKGNLIGRRLNLLARIALIRGNQDDAVLFAEQALKQNGDKGLELERANSLRLLGRIKARQQQFIKAEELLLEALRIDQQQADSEKIASDLEALAEYAGLANKIDMQQDYTRRAQAAREHHRMLRKGVR